MKDVLKELEDNKIDASKLGMLRTDYSQKEELPTAGGILDRASGIRNVTQPLAISNILR